MRFVGRIECGRGLEELLREVDLIAELRADETLQRFGLRLELLEKEASAGQFCGVWRFFQQLDGLVAVLGGFGGIFPEGQTLENFCGGEAKNVAEAVLILVGFGVHSVGHTVSEHGCERRFIGDGVDEPAADDDRVADGKQFEIRSEQQAATQVDLPIEVVGDYEVVDHDIQESVDGAGRSEDAVAFEQVEDVVFGFMTPFALGFERGTVVLRALVFHRGGTLDEDAAQLIGAGAGFELVAPQVRGGFVIGNAEADRGIEFLAVDVAGEPEAGFHVAAPRIKMQVVVILECFPGKIHGRSVLAIEPHDERVLVFHPHAADETRTPGLPRGRDIENVAAYLA